MIFKKNSIFVRVLILLLICCLCSSMFVACGTNSEEPTVDSTETPTESPTSDVPTEPPTTTTATEPPEADVPTEPPTTEATTDPPSTEKPAEPTDPPSMEDPADPPKEPPTDPTEKPKPTEYDSEKPSEKPSTAPSEKPSEPPSQPPCEHEYTNACDATCNKCGHERTPAEHIAEEIPKIEASCTDVGYTAGEKCSVCDKVLVVPEATPVSTAHSYSTTFEYNETSHWRQCTVCEATSTPSSHSYNDDNSCKRCGYKTIPSSAASSIPGYAKAFDYIKLDGVVIAGAGTSVSSDTFSSMSISSGQEVMLQGWAGFSSAHITTFGYYFNSGIYDAVVNDSFKQVAQQPVIDAGGEYRFAIGADTSKLAAGKHTVSFVAVLEDGTYAIMKTITLTVESSGGNVSDDNVVKAEKEQLGDVDMTLTDNGSNQYTSPSGLVFNASASDLVFSNGMFTISSTYGLKISFPDYADRFYEYFNRYKIAYYSSAPLKVTVTYSQDGSSIADTIYLEAGDNMLFNCLIKGYLGGMYANNITSMDIKVLGSSSTANFVLYNVSTESIDIIGSNSLQYLSNDRYRLGIKLAWGGGISYLRDNEDGNSAISNLINDADTGRLIQQSYYGTNNTSEYQPGTYGENTAWHYNPVQGGSLSNTPSRIIDLELSSGSIYIKAQPQDWAKTELTPSYMENVYTLYSNRIQVDNRFVDFAGFKTNPVRHQELPAFYTIGYLNTFKFYNGTNSWSNGSLQIEENLAFWGGNSSAYFSLKKGNKETWCAWVNNDTDYGLGLYTPNIDILLAGRHAYEIDPDATNSSSTACSYVAPLNSFKIVSYEALEYSYLITSGSTAEIRTLFKTYKDFASNADLTSSAFSYNSNRT